MAKASPKKTEKSPAGTLPAVIVVAGEETFLREQFLAEIRATVFGDQDPGMGYIRLDGAALMSGDGGGVATILDEVRTASMFAPKKLVVVDPADPLFKKRAAGGGEDEDAESEAATPGTADNREILERFVAETTAGGGGVEATLVLVATSWLKTTRLHKAIEKAGGFRLAEAIKPHLAPNWVARRAPEAHEKQIEPAAASRLVELVGPELQRLDNELAKLALFETGDTITLAAVNTLVGFQHEQQIWEMINALAGRDAATALKKIDEIWAIDSKIGYTAAGAVYFWLGQVLKARELADSRLPDAVIGQKLKLWPPDRAQKVLALARTWGLHGAARWSRAILEMDLANKSSLGEPRRNLEKFVVELSLG